MARTKHKNVDGSKDGTPRRVQISREEHDLRKDLLWGTREEKEYARKRLIQMGVLEE